MSTSTKEPQAEQNFHNRKYVIQGKQNLEKARIDYAVENMAHNKAYQYAAQKNPDGDQDLSLLNEFKEKFKNYRHNWRNIPKSALEKKLGSSFFKETGQGPLCVDIELAAVCDLACPFCYRQFIVTPDKLMNEKFAYSLIDQCVELNVPSIKFNWRGEPLLHPKLPEIINYAKKQGILETIINTNAVTLTEKKANSLIESGLDLVIYSFDGGTKKTYEKNRPGRFKHNHFEDVYENIKNFSKIREKLGAKFPRTKIQMILTAETYQEQEEFFKNFEPYVDDVSLKAYTERGGNIKDLDDETQKKLKDYLVKNHLPDQVEYYRNMEGQIFISKGRLPCEQLYQRMLVTYDGRVGMCCYDWGAQHAIGYASTDAYTTAPKDYEDVLKKTNESKSGFELLKNIKMPPNYSRPENKEKTLKEIWDDKIVNQVRDIHLKGKVDSLPVCKSCAFKETYLWEEVQK